jgi:hypothetical protein
MRKIAFWRTFGAALRATFTRRLLAVLEPRLIAAGLVLVLGDILGTLRLGLLLALAATWVAVLLAFTSFAVAWHRALLLGPEATAADRLRIGPREWRFVGYSLAIPLLVGVPVGIVASLGSFIAGAALAPAVVGPAIDAAAVLAGTVIAMRLALVLPAVAIDEPGASLVQAWQRSRGNAWRLAAGWLLCLAVFAPAVFLYVLLATSVAAGSLALELLLGLGLLALEFLEFAVAVAFLSLAYQQLRTPDA